MLRPLRSHQRRPVKIVASVVHCAMQRAECSSSSALVAGGMVVGVVGSSRCCFSGTTPAAALLRRLCRSAKQRLHSRAVADVESVLETCWLPLRVGWGVWHHKASQPTACIQSTLSLALLPSFECSGAHRHCQKLRTRAANALHLDGPQCTRAPAGKRRRLLLLFAAVSYSRAISTKENCFHAIAREGKEIGA